MKLFRSAYIDIGFSFKPMNLEPGSKVLELWFFNIGRQKLVSFLEILERTLDEHILKVGLVDGFI